MESIYANYFFREDLEQYFNAGSYKFEVPTADTLEITGAAMHIVNEIYKPGIKYKKSGVMIGDIASGCVQNFLFDPIDRREERLRLSCQMDRLNQKYGLKTVRVAVEGESRESWKVKIEHKSVNYLTDINQLLTVYI